MSHRRTLILPGEPPDLQVGWNTFWTGSPIALGMSWNNANALNSEVQFATDLLPGNYTITVWHRATNTYGIVTVTFGGLPAGTIDQYASTLLHRVTTLTVPNVPKNPLLRLQVTGRHPSSTNYGATFSGILIKPAP
jgi:hypothetical protein